MTEDYMLWTLRNTSSPNNNKKPDFTISQIYLYFKIYFSQDKVNTKSFL